MMSLIRARIPSLVVFGTVETLFAGFVYYQWRQQKEVAIPIRSAIPKGYIGSSRFSHAYELAQPQPASA